MKPEIKDNIKINHPRLSPQSTLREPGPPELITIGN
jgi:hypothetical protein